MRTRLASADARLAAVILAAGGSKRLGRTKQLLRYRCMPLILRSVRLARHGTRGRIVVVLGDQRQRLRSLLHRHAKDVIVVGNAHWHEGLASSLAAGLQAIPPNVRAALILLVDQAGLEATDIKRLVAAWRARPTRPAAAHYQGRAGVPAVIPRRWFRSLATLGGDVGARHVLRRLGDVSLVAMPSAELDVDTPADAAALGA